jgi:GTP cyclohydrolase I
LSDLDGESEVVLPVQEDREWERVAPRQITKAQWRQLEGYAGEIFRTMGMRLDSPGTRGTPRRFIRALFDATEGYEGDSKLVTAFPTECDDGPDCRISQIVQGPIPFHSVCEHHAFPFFGQAWIGYIAHERIIGLSKLTRVVRLYARRFSMQERLGRQVIEALDGILAAHGVAVYLDAAHLCMQMRGVREHEATTRTTLWRGAYESDERLRDEFLNICRNRAQPSPQLDAMTFRISRREGFNAAHQLRDATRTEDENRRLYGKCVNLHGHNYVLEVEVAGSVDPATGYVMDLKRLSDLMTAEIIQHVDHHNLNTDVAWLSRRIPTAENLARAFWERLRPHLPQGSLRTVRVYETEKNWAECRDDD